MMIHSRTRFTPPRRILVGTALAGASAFALVTSVGAPAASSGSASAKSISFLAKTISQGSADPLFPRPGDTTVAVLRNLRHGRVIGEDRTACIVVDASTDVQCTTTVMLPGGSLAATFTQSETSLNIVGAVIGGTGRYDGARGQFSLRRIGHTSNFNVVARLL